MASLMFWLDNRLTVAEIDSVHYDEGGHALFTVTVDGTEYELPTPKVTLI